MSQGFDTIAESASLIQRIMPPFPPAPPAISVIPAHHRIHWNNVEPFPFLSFDGNCRNAVPSRYESDAEVLISPHSIPEMA